MNTICHDVFSCGNTRQIHKEHVLYTLGSMRLKIHDSIISWDLLFISYHIICIPCLSSILELLQDCIHSGWGVQTFKITQVLRNGLFLQNHHGVRVEAEREPTAFWIVGNIPGILRWRNKSWIIPMSTWAIHQNCKPPNILVKYVKVKGGDNYPLFGFIGDMSNSSMICLGDVGE